MKYSVINMENYPRRGQFDYFRSLAYPYAGLTVNVDITDFRRMTKARGADFYFSLCYCVYRAANAIPEFRQRIRGDGIIEYERSPLSCTLALPDGNYCYCELECELPYEEFLISAAEDKRRALSRGSVEESDDADARLFISCVPWLSYTSITQPVPYPADSNPRIVWGKLFQQEDRILIPVSLLCNHAIMDGRQMAGFYEQLEKEMAALL